MIEPLLMPGDLEVDHINTDWLNDDKIMTLQERIRGEQMIDIKNAENKESRFMKLAVRYDGYADLVLKKQIISEDLNAIFLKDISITLALIYDEMRGLSDGT